MPFKRLLTALLQARSFRASRTAITFQPIMVCRNRNLRKLYVAQIYSSSIPRRAFNSNISFNILDTPYLH